MSDDKLKSRDAEIRQLIECLSRIVEWAEPLAKNYWYGKKYSGSGDKMWEFLCKNAKIIKEVKVR
jgi:hypothetical protein